VRKHPRIDVGQRCRIEREKAPVINASLLNISMGGAGLESLSPLREGEFFVLAVENGVQALRIRCRVRHVRDLWWRAGAPHQVQSAACPRPLVKAGDTRGVRRSIARRNAWSRGVHPEHFGWRGVIAAASVSVASPPAALWWIIKRLDRSARLRPKLLMIRQCLYLRPPTQNLPAFEPRRSP
jgi:hypothetical protein